MRLLILTQYFPPEVGAPQNRLYELAIRLQQRGVEVSVLTAMPNYPQMQIHPQYKGQWFCKEQMQQMQIFRSWIYVSKSKSVIKRLLNYFSFVFSSLIVGLTKINKQDILFVESPPLFLGISAYAIAKAKGAKFVFNVSDLWPESAEKLGIISNRFLLNRATKLEEFCYRKADLISGQTQGIVANISARFPNKKVHWLKNGVDIKLYDAAKTETKGQFRKAKGYKDSDFILFYGGIIGYAQGLEVILQAADKLRHYSDIRFILMGNGPEKTKLQEMKSSLQLSNVDFYDAVPKEQMHGVITDIDASIIPLKKLELFKGAIPSKIFENLAMKKPVILGIEGEAKELFVNQGKCGLAFEPENASNLTEKILELYNDRTKAATLGENGLRYAAENFNRDKIAQEFYNHLAQL